MVLPKSPLTKRSRNVRHFVALATVAVTFLLRVSWPDYLGGSNTPQVTMLNVSLLAADLRPTNVSALSKQGLNGSKEPSSASLLDSTTHRSQPSQLLESPGDGGQMEENSKSNGASNDNGSENVFQDNSANNSSKENQKVQQSEPTSPINMSSIRVVNEMDVSRDYTNQTTFNLTYFDSSPQCDPLKPDEVSFTFITQASWDRLWIMKHHCQRWPAPHPMSIAVYLPPDSTHDEFDIARELDENLQCDLSRMTVTVMKGISPMDKYPVNILRNLAVQASKTSHIVYIDSDFLISDGLYDSLMSMAPVIAEDPKAGVVVPAFIYHSACEGGFSSDNKEALSCLEGEWSTAVPKTKADLLELIKQKDTERPTINVGFHGVYYHSTTMYTEWMNQTEPLKIPCMRSDLYEPYLAVRLCNNLPEFPPMFRGYGWNKVIWTQTLLLKLAYKLWQLPSGFVFHLPHEQSASRQQFKTAEGQINKVPLHEAYLAWHRKQRGIKGRIPGCKRQK